MGGTETASPLIWQISSTGLSTMTLMANGGGSESSYAPLTKKHLRLLGKISERDREQMFAKNPHLEVYRTSTMREGVAWCDAVNADAFLITLKKSDRDYSPTTMYRDFALSPDLFH